MVNFYESDIYEVMTYDWESGRNIRNNLRNHLGISNFRLFDKIKYAVKLQYWDISVADFYFKLENLKKQRLVESRIIPEIIDDQELKDYQYRKTTTGKKVKVPEINVGRLGLEGTI